MQNDPKIKKQTKIITIGKKEAGFFDNSNKTINIPVLFRGYSYNTNKIDAFKKIVFISGVKYETFEKDNNITFLIYCSNIKQLQRLKNLIEEIYSDYKSNVKCILSQDCYDFFK